MATNKKKALRTGAKKKTHAAKPVADDTAAPFTADNDNNIEDNEEAVEEMIQELESDATDAAGDNGSDDNL